MTIDQFVQNHVIRCVSPLITLLSSPEAQSARPYVGSDFGNLLDQAAELTYPMPDYEEQARQLSFTQQPDGTWISPSGTFGVSAQDVCEGLQVDPYYWEIFEHWDVSSFLAHRLQQQGEYVNRDFGGLEVWARTTTGQSIAMDGVIIKIYRELTSQRAGG
jgi:hypothetical protein